MSLNFELSFLFFLNMIIVVVDLLLETIIVFTVKIVRIVINIKGSIAEFKKSIHKKEMACQKSIYLNLLLYYLCYHM